MSDLGHNSGVDLDLTLDPLPPRDAATPTDDRLRLLVERIDRELARNPEGDMN